MATTNEYPTKTLFTKTGDEIVVEPLTSAHLGKALRALKKRSIVLKVNEISDDNLELVTEHALWVVASWKDKDGVDRPAIQKRELLVKFGVYRDDILNAAKKLNDEWDEQNRLEEKNS